MIKIGTAGIPAGCKSSNNAPKFLAEHGLDAIELEFVRSIYMNKQKAKEFSVEAKKHNISVSVHAPYFINLNSADIRIIEKSKSILENCLQICDCLEATVCVAHTAYYSGKSKEETFSVIKKNIEFVLNKTKTKTLFGIEVMGKQSQFGGLEEVLTLCSLIKGAVPVIDFAHIHAITNGSIKTKEDFSRILDLCKRYGFSNLHCHFSGILYNNGNEKKHLPINSNEPDYKQLADVLNKKKYNITLICESPFPLEDALLFKKYKEKKIHYFSF